MRTLLTSLAPASVLCTVVEPFHLQLRCAESMWLVARPPAPKPLHLGCTHHRQTDGGCGSRQAPPKHSLVTAAGRQWLDCPLLPCGSLAFRFDQTHPRWRRQCGPAEWHRQEWRGQCARSSATLWATTSSSGQTGSTSTRNNSKTPQTRASQRGLEAGISGPQNHALLVS